MKDIKRVDTPFGRVYVIKTTEGINIYPSVTTILSSEPQAWLEHLKTNIGEEGLAKISQKAADRGTVMHTYLENYLICMGYHGKGDTCLLYAQKKTSKDMAGQFDEQAIAKGRDLFYNMLNSPLFDKMQRPLFSEKFLWSHQIKFAGTADFGYEDNGDIVIGDFKSASSPRSSEQVDKYKKQLGAYSIAHEERTGQVVTRGEVWISHPDGVQEIILKGPELEKAKQEFEVLCKTYHRNWDKTHVIKYLKFLKDSKMKEHESEG